MAYQNASFKFNNQSETKNGNLTEVTSEIDLYNHRVHPAILIAVFVCVGWILLANAVIVICFIINRKKMWPAFVVQIFCLSLSDLFVGVVTLPYLILPLLISKDSPAVPFGVCSSMLYALLNSQCGSLYHILSICAYRCFRIETATRMPETHTRCRTPVRAAVIAWSISFLLCSVPFLFWADPGVTLYFCLLHNVFSEKKKAMGYYTCIILVPQVLTNCLYVVACIRLRSLWRRTFPALADSSVPQSGTSNYSNPVSAGYSRTNFRLERRFMGTMGIVMVVYNICTIPLMVLAIIENTQHATRDIRYAMCALFVMNSALNPLIYALRSSWLQNALKRLYEDTNNCFICL